MNINKTVNELKSLASEDAAFIVGFLSCCEWTMISLSLTFNVSAYTGFCSTGSASIVNQVPKCPAINRTNLFSRTSNLAKYLLRAYSDDRRAGWNILLLIGYDKILRSSDENNSKSELSPPYAHSLVLNHCDTSSPGLISASPSSSFVTSKDTSQNDRPRLSWNANML